MAININIDSQVSQTITDGVTDKAPSENAVFDALALKVDKEIGKGLSSNDYTTTEKNKLAGIEDGAQVNVNADWNAVSGDAEILNKPTIPSITGLATVTYVDNQDALKVDKVAGKGLSANDFTDVLKTKLDGIQDGAEVNVNADWNATSGDAQILNKPTIPSAQVNSDWNAVSGVAQILNKPTIPSISGLVPDTRNLTINGVTYDLSADRSWTVAATASVLQHAVKAGEAMTKGQAVYVSSADGTNMIVSKASNATEGTSSKTMGLIIQNLAINGQGFVMTEGLLTGLNTASATAGDPVWLGTNGDLIYGLINKPAAPAHLVFIGIVTRANVSTGEIFIRVQNGFELQELHNVSITSVADNNILQYDSASSLWKNETLSNAGIQATLPAATNSVNGYLLATDWVIFNGKESGLTFSSPLSRSVNTISIPVATTLVNGYLSATDWTAFNSKASYTPRVQSVTSAATVTPISTNDLVKITAQAVPLTIANPTGTWDEGQSLIIRIKDNATARAITWGTNYRAIGITLPTTTTLSKTTYVGFIYNLTDAKWDAIGVTTQA